MAGRTLRVSSCGSTTSGDPTVTILSSTGDTGGTWICVA
jgi:hypothetical protein